MLYVRAHTYLSNSLGAWLRAHGHDASLAETIIQLHLRHDAYIMPIQVDLAAQRALVSGQQATTDMSSDLLRCVEFEVLTNFTGVFRVFARTLLNRSGVADLVSRGGGDRGDDLLRHVSPRVAAVLDSLGATQEMRNACNYDTLLALVEGVAVAKLGANAERGFEDVDVVAIRRLRQAGAESLDENVIDLGRRVGSYGWARWIRGLHSGLNYFHRAFDFDNDRFWHAVHAAEAIDSGPLRLANELQANVQEMGLALALSFYGDLGRPEFAKPDKHVTDALAALVGERVSSRKGLALLQHHAREARVSPRCLDKVLYLAGSGKFYLTGHDLNGSLKPGLLHALQN